MSPVRRHSPAPFAAPAAPRALTLVEMLIAMAIAGIFFSSVIAAFVSILRASHNVEIETNAVGNARAALENLSVDLKQADHLSAGWHFIGANFPTAYGSLGTADTEYGNNFREAASCPSSSIPMQVATVWASYATALRAEMARRGVTAPAFPSTVE